MARLLCLLLCLLVAATGLAPPMAVPPAAPPQLKQSGGGTLQTLRPASVPAADVSIFAAHHQSPLTGIPFMVHSEAIQPQQAEDKVLRILPGTYLTESNDDTPVFAVLDVHATAPIKVSKSSFGALLLALFAAAGAVSCWRRTALQSLPGAHALEMTTPNDVSRPMDAVGDPFWSCQPRLALAAVAGEAISTLAPKTITVSARTTKASLSDDDRGTHLQAETVSDLKSQECGQRMQLIPSALLDRRTLITSACAACILPLPRRATAAVDVETKSPFVTFSKQLLPTEAPPSSAGPLDDIAWDAPKRTGFSIERLSDAINDGLIEREWFVTGRGLPQYFSDSFTFSDPDVSLTGYEAYCRQVRRLFDQETARCEVICCSITAPNTLTVLWRNSGKVILGPLKVELKPYLVTTTLRTDADSGLVISQEDAFDVDGLGLLLYQVPALRPLTTPPAASFGALKQQCDFNTCMLRPPSACTERIEGMCVKWEGNTKP